MFIYLNFKSHLKCRNGWKEPFNWNLYSQVFRLMIVRFFVFCPYLGQLCRARFINDCGRQSNFWWSQNFQWIENQRWEHICQSMAHTKEKRKSMCKYLPLIVVHILTFNFDLIWFFFCYYLSSLFFLLYF